jgi:pimeloyl-ACP methyl ester carboxylesterase
VIGLEAAARRPDRIDGVAAYEPPYGVLGDRTLVAWFRRVARDTQRAFGAGGSPAAAETFLRHVAGDEAWDRLPARARTFLEREGTGALADAALTGLDPDGLARVAPPVTIITGDASQPFYASIADELGRRIPGAVRVHLPGATHTTPITDPAPVAAAVLAALSGAATDPEPAPAVLEPAR